VDTNEAVAILRGEISPASVLQRGIAEKMGAEALERIVALEAALEAKHQQYTGAVIALTEARKDTERLDYVDGLGDIGLIAIDNDLEGVHIQIVWNRFDIAGVPSNLRAAIDLHRGTR